jgi:hypothetical protein
MAGTFVHKENNGSLFKNERKEKPTHADYQGTINVAGTEYWISGWLKEASTGKKYMSLAVNPKEVDETQRQLDALRAQAKKVNVKDIPDDDIPF